MIFAPFFNMTLSCCDPKKKPGPEGGENDDDKKKKAPEQEDQGDDDEEFPDLYNEKDPDFDDPDEQEFI